MTAVGTILVWMGLLPYNSDIPRKWTAEGISIESGNQKWTNKETSQWVALLAQESAFNIKAINKRSGTLGIGQISPLYLGYFQKKIGWKADPMTLTGGLALSAYVFNQCIKVHSQAEKRFGCYFAGMFNKCVTRWPLKACPETNAHIGKVMKNWRKITLDSH